jgi:hypothetical protein
MKFAANHQCPSCARNFATEQMYTDHLTPDNGCLKDAVLKSIGWRLRRGMPVLLGVWHGNKKSRLDERMGMPHTAPIDTWITDESQLHSTNSQGRVVA